MHWTNREGFQWNWQHETRSWVEGAWGTVEPVVFDDQSDPMFIVESFTTDQIANLTTAQING